MKYNYSAYIQNEDFSSVVDGARECQTTTLASRELANGSACSTMQSVVQAACFEYLLVSGRIKGRVETDVLLHRFCTLQPDFLRAVSYGAMI